MKTCNCGNTEFGFDCVCEFMKANPGTKEYTCEYCGIYNASTSRCNHCEEDEK